MSKFLALKNQFQRALQRLKEALSQPKNDIVRDSAIQRFEFTLDLSWKLLKTILEEQKGIIVNSPKECFREAYRQKIIDYDEAWIKFVDMRNETVHTYKEEIAEKIFDELPEASKHFEALLNIIEKGAY